jgi:hypothetical protein
MFSYKSNSVFSNRNQTSMKKIFWIGAILLSAFSFAHAQDQNDNQSDDVYYSGPPEDQENQATNPDDGSDQGGPTYQTFYDGLSPYGSWVNYPGYGYCWVPSNMPGDFSPYGVGGHWVFTDYGWTWVSDYPWGWACFHYGRWFMDASYGWLWCPGYDWAPAWVVWGDYGGYYCWAPIGPGVIVSPHYRPDPSYWHFCEHNHITETNISHYVIHHEEFARISHMNVNEINNHINVINHASTYNQSVFFAGPKSTEVEKYTGQKVNKIAVNNVNKPGESHVNGNTLNIYRPSISRTTHQPTPANAKPANNNAVRDQGGQPHPGGQQQHPGVQQQPGHPAEQQRQPNNWTPPRQSAPRPVQPPAQPPQRSQPQQPAPRQPERSFVPTERPAPSYHPAPAPSYHAPAGGGFGGGGRGGGGRH